MRTLTLFFAFGLTATPVLAQTAESLSARVGFVALSTRRAASFEHIAGTSRATMNGLEFSVRRGRLGLAARGTTARFLSDSVAIAAGRVSYGDVRLRYGTELLSGELGAGRRGLAGSLGRRDWSFIRIGAKSMVPIGGSGLTASVALGWYPSVNGSGDFQSGTGADAETRLTYDLPTFPVYVSMGYRVERFTSRSPEDIRPDELSSLFIGAGLRLTSDIFGDTPQDEDEDGVRDDRDACLATPRGARVDAVGCRIDSDGDGVFDEADLCPDTPLGVRVDQQGCRTDEDLDGVFDEDDLCPDTPMDAGVNEVGCRTDADDDGVFDDDDECPGTPARALVNRRGCRTDTDADGVFDGIDACPNTPLNTEVDRRGCTILFEENETSLVLEGVRFVTDSSELTTNAETVLDLVANALLDNPDVRVRVAGHTDSSGGRDYNVTLSQQRAESVVRYLVEKGVAADRMEAEGFGPDRPIADNETPEGRQVNRRVELERIDEGGGTE